MSLYFLVLLLNGPPTLLEGGYYRFNGSHSMFTCFVVKLKLSIYLESSKEMRSHPLIRTPESCITVNGMYDSLQDPPLFKCPFEMSSFKLMTHSVVNLVCFKFFWYVNILFSKKWYVLVMFFENLVCFSQNLPKNLLWLFWQGLRNKNKELTKKF